MTAAESDVLNPLEWTEEPPYRSATDKTKLAFAKLNSRLQCC